MAVGTGLKDVGSTTPLAEVVRRVLMEQSAPISVEELTTSVIDAWGRELPVTPYLDHCLIYKLSVGMLGCAAHYDKLPGGVAPAVDRPYPEEEPLVLNATMRFEELNEMVEAVRQVRLVLANKAGKKK